MIRVAYFGLPLAALLLSSDGFAPELVVLSPIAAPGARRLRRSFGARVLEARGMTPSELERVAGSRLASLDVDLLVSWYWTRRIPPAWFAALRLGAIGAHPSLLPQHRGPDPFFAAIDSGDDVTGVSVHELTERYDEGAVLYTERVEIGNRDAWQLARALDRPSLRLLRRAVRDLSAGQSLTRTVQDERRATWAPAPSGDALRIDWRWPTERVLRRIRALTPVPGLALEIHAVPFTVTRATMASEFPMALAPGEAAVRAAGVVIRTLDGAVLVTRATVDFAGVEEAVVDARGLAAILAAKNSVTES